MPSIMAAVIRYVLGARPGLKFASPLGSNIQRHMVTASPTLAVRKGTQPAIINGNVTQNPKNEMMRDDGGAQLAASSRCAWMSPA